MSSNLTNDAFKSRFIILLLAILLIVGGGLGALLHYFFEDYLPNWYFGILIFFFCVEMVIIYLIEVYSRKLSAIKLTNFYIGIRTGKVVLGIAFVALYALIVKEGIKSFVLTFMFFYILFIVFDTYYTLKVEKRLKGKSN